MNDDRKQALHELTESFAKIEKLATKFHVPSKTMKVFRSNLADAILFKTDHELTMEDTKEAALRRVRDSIRSEMGVLPRNEVLCDSEEDLDSSEG